MADKLTGTDGGGTYFSGPVQSDDGYVVTSSSTTPTNSSARKLYMDSSDDLYWWDGSSAVQVNQGGGGSVGTLDGVYENGQTLDLDRGAIVMTDATTGALDSLSIVQTGVKSGNLLDLSADAAFTGNALNLDMNLGIAAVGILIDNGAGARTGSDIQVTSDSSGTHSVIDINATGSGAVTGFDFIGSNNGSPGGYGVNINLNDTDNLDTTPVLITRGSGARGVPAIQIDETSTGSVACVDLNVSGVYTGNIVDITTSAAATGNAFYADLDSAVAMTGLHIEGSGVRTQPMVEIITDSTSSASLIDVSVDGAITGQAALDIDMNAGLAANAVYIDVGAGTRTANLFEVKYDGDGAVDCFSIVGTDTSSGHIMDIDMGGIHTGNVFDIDMDAAVGAIAINIDAGAGTRTVALVDLQHDGDGNVAAINIDHTNTGSGNIIDLDIDAVHTGNAINVNYGTGAATGNALDITTGTNVAGSAVAITTAGARTAPLFLVTGAATDGGTDDHTFDINQTGAQDSNVFDVTYSSGVSTGNAIDLNMGSNVAGMAIDVGSAATGTSGEGACFNVAHTGDLGAGADVVRIESTGNISSTSTLLSLEQNTGAGTSGSVALYINSTGTNVEAIKVDAGTVVFDETLLVTGISTLTGGSVNGAKWIRGGTGAITTSSGAAAVAVTGSIHEVTTTGTGDALTLANGTAGQRLTVIYVAEGAGADTAILTPTTLAGGATITFNALGDSADLTYSSTGGWYMAGGTAVIAA